MTKELNLGRLGPYFSDRIAFGPAPAEPFKKEAIERLGRQRFERICQRYSLNLDQGSLSSRDIAKVIVGSRDVRMADICETQPSFDPLSSVDLAKAYHHLRSAFDSSDYKVPEIKGRISGGATEWFARLFFDPFVADRERLSLCKGHPKDLFSVFIHNMAARVVKREMEVGTLIPAPDDPQGSPRFYYLSGKLATGRGMVSYLFHPATRDTDLPPLRFFRGSAFRPGELDALSTLITDLEEDLGRTAYESGIPYEPLIQKFFPPISTEVGHSLGATIVQYRLANSDHIRKAYLFNGPGLPSQETSKFNQRMETADHKVELVIRQCNPDKANALGQLHLGFQAPKNVDIDFMKYHVQESETHPHVAVWGCQPHSKYGIEGMDQKSLDLEFNHEKNTLEKIRYWAGWVFSLIFKFFRDAFRSFFPSTHSHGLYIGWVENNQWHTLHIR